MIGKEGNVFNELVLVDHRATSKSIKTSVFDDSIIENRRFKCSLGQNSDLTSFAELWRLPKVVIFGNCFALTSSNALMINFS